MLTELQKCVCVCVGVGGDTAQTTIKLEAQIELLLFFLIFIKDTLLCFGVVIQKLNDRTKESGGKASQQITSLVSLGHLSSSVALLLFFLGTELGCCTVWEWLYSGPGLLRILYNYRCFFLQTSTLLSWQEWRAGSGVLSWKYCYYLEATPS